MVHDVPLNNAICSMYGMSILYIITVLHHITMHTQCCAASTTVLQVPLSAVPQVSYE